MGTCGLDVSRRHHDVADLGPPLDMKRKAEVIWPMDFPVLLIFAKPRQVAVWANFDGRLQAEETPLHFIFHSGHKLAQE